MIDNNKLLAVIKSYLPDADVSIYQRIADDIKRDMDATILSMVRQAVAQERRANYEQKY